MRRVALVLAVGVLVGVTMAGCDRFQLRGRWNPADPGYEGVSDPANAEGVLPVGPTGLAADGLARGRIVLSWLDNAHHEQGFRIERKEGAGGAYAEIGRTEPNVLTLTDASVSPSTAYSYRVCAYNAMGDSRFAAEVTVTSAGAPRMSVRTGSTGVPSGSGAYAFSDVVVGGSADVTFTIENLGTADLLLTGESAVEVEGADLRDVSVPVQPASPIAPSGSAVFTVRFAPRSGGAKSATLSIASDDPGANPYTLGVTGRALTTWAKSYGGTADDVLVAVLGTADGGYLAPGYTASFGRGTDLWLLGLDFLGDVVWQRSLGGDGEDWVADACATADGGAIVCSQQNSAGAGGWDAHVAKLTASGVVEWQRAYGGPGSDGARWIHQGPNGGYVLLGVTDSYGAGGLDLWVLKLSSAGDVEWERTYGGAAQEHMPCGFPTTDGGFVVALQTQSLSATQDIWVLKFSSTGTCTWQKTYGSTAGWEFYPLIRQTGDGGYIVVSETWGFGAGGCDMWVVKLDGSGSIVWQKSYGGASDDHPALVYELAGGDLLLGCSSYSYGAGGGDLWLLRVSASGTPTWQFTYGGSGDEVRSLQNQIALSQLAVIPVTPTSSFGAGGFDGWLLCFDPSSGAPQHTDAASGVYLGVATNATITTTNALPAVTSVTGQTSMCTVTPTTFTPLETTGTVEVQYMKALP